MTKLLIGAILIAIGSGCSSNTVTVPTETLNGDEDSSSKEMKPTPSKLIGTTLEILCLINKRPEFLTNTPGQLRIGCNLALNGTMLSNTSLEGKFVWNISNNLATTHQRILAQRIDQPNFLASFDITGSDLQSILDSGDRIIILLNKSGDTSAEIVIEKPISIVVQQFDLLKANVSTISNAQDSGKTDITVLTSGILDIFKPIPAPSTTSPQTTNNVNSPPESNEQPTVQNNVSPKDPKAIATSHCDKKLAKQTGYKGNGGLWEYEGDDGYGCYCDEADEEDDYLVWYNTDGAVIGNGPAKCG